jgi:hypothetical protein
MEQKRKLTRSVNAANIAVGIKKAGEETPPACAYL